MMTTSTRSSDSSSHFLQLPLELRRLIYAELLLPSQSTDLSPDPIKLGSTREDYYDYDKELFGTGTTDLSNPTLLIRSITPTLGAGALLSPTDLRRRVPNGRTTYTIRSDRFGARCMQTSYHCLNIPGIQNQLSILRTNRQVHAEATELLYGSYKFDFDTHVEAIVPFLSDLNPLARSCIKSIRIVKRALASDKEFDRAEWSTALRYLTSHDSGISLRRLDLGVVAGRPGENGWESTARYSAHDFAVLKDIDGMEWMQYLLEFHGLQHLDVSAVVEHCAPATNSTAMAKFIQFSASVDTGFSDFLRGRLLTASA